MQQPPQPSSASAITQQQQTTYAPPSDPLVRHTPESHGYAELVGADFRFVVREKLIQLGRRMPPNQTNERPKTAPQFFGISSAKNISRIHSEIYYVPHPHQPNQLAGHWEMFCLGKNGLERNADFIQSHKKFTIQHKDRLKIGDTVFYFLEPIPMDPTQHTRTP